MTEYERNDEARNCNCARQCRQLTYDYTVSHAEYSDFHIAFVKDTTNLNSTSDKIKYDICTLEVIMTSLSIRGVYRGGADATCVQFGSRGERIPSSRGEEFPQIYGSY